MRAPSRKRKASKRPGWYLLVHQLPPEPLYFRAKIRQRLARSGAVALKKAVYVLPRQAQCLEEFRRIAAEAIAGGGEAWACEAEFLDPATDAALVARFQSERNADYEAATTAIERKSGANAAARLDRARKLFSEIERIDFFAAPARARLQRLVRELESSLPGGPTRTEGPRRKLAGKTWVTRRGLHIDRLASAWLIRRFIDPAARFRFIDPKEPARAGQLRFDIEGGDFTHEDDRCTFETLLARAGVTDPAAGQIGEIVHDIDLKDGKFGRPEASGVERVVTGLLLGNPGDEARLERGLALFDELHQSFQKRHSLPFQEVSR